MVLGPENTEIQPIELSYTFESNALDLVTNSFFTAIKVNLLNLNKRVWLKNKQNIWDGHGGLFLKLKDPQSCSSHHANVL